MKFVSILFLLIMNINQTYNMNENNINSHHLYDLKYLNASKTEFLLKIILAKNNEAIPTIQSYDGTTLLIIANEKNWKCLEKLIDELDKPQPQPQLYKKNEIYH